ncbi:MAG TPA: type II toxin-antitoxin system death-on-curing family toxin [Pseudolabrys sp.]|nr:type II toxin-antitoxin system death-on-curing family toxin [Pseudolabrys sp.]
MRSEPDWLDIDIVLDFHAEQLALFGGADGIRDRGLLESALARPLNKFAYGENSITVLAAAYGFGIARNHPFIDGNKRTALASMIVFLGLNGLDLGAPQEAATAMILSLAAGEATEKLLAQWLADNCVPLDAPGIAP